MPNNSPSKIVDYNILNLSYDITKDTVLIFMPTYNRTEYIINSLESLVKQDYHDVLIHVIDDNSDQDVIGLITDYIVKNNIL
jgi:glycosyltransferase involved in cell wall biosynthesis